MSAGKVKEHSTLACPLGARAAPLSPFLALGLWTHEGFHSLQSFYSFTRESVCRWVQRGCVAVHCVCVTVAGPLAGLQRGPSLLLSSWVGAHQISWLPFIALSLIAIILGEEIAVSHPRLTHSQRDRSHPHGGGVTDQAGRLALSLSLATQGTGVLGRGGERGGLYVEEEGNI